MENRYYFYSGFNAPKEVDINDLIIADNYTGEVDFLEEHEEYKNDSDDDYNEMMNQYKLFRNPKLSNFVIENSTYFDKQGLLNYLEDWSSRGSLLDVYDMIDLVDRKFDEIEDIDWEEDNVDIYFYAEKLGYIYLKHIEMFVKNN